MRSSLRRGATEARMIGKRTYSELVDMEIDGDLGDLIYMIDLDSRMCVRGRQKKRARHISHVWWEYLRRKRL